VHFLAIFRTILKKFSTAIFRKMCYNYIANQILFGKVWCLVRKGRLVTALFAFYAIKKAHFCTISEKAEIPLCSFSPFTVLFFGQYDYYFDYYFVT